ncbi:ATP-binding protein [Algoriphagus halophytocola]|uniref:ATP-binding protein n=1 Tax=Algoriphagus halophytocola TaxID=2991499 RepID=A0ABY6MDH2_9BACT|nr:ATP-binding protein [Algoriphagus sp. TR-M5]UZD21801.1 ATP-binding protein [Algoriphagus sp. TR-M5]
MADFSVSINIIRDQERDIHYIPTPNAKQVYERIANNFQTGHRAFNIVGSYGTGKSSFLWALEQNLGGKSDAYFGQVNGHFKGIKSFDFINLIGESRSFKEAFAERIQTKENSTKAILRGLDQKISETSCTVIVVDEFGKYLEYAVSHDPGVELYFIQELAEFANSPDRNLILITALHQNFGSYFYSLKANERNEWEKVRGRLLDISFNEPVEQLLFLAAERQQELGFQVADEDKFEGLKSLLQKSNLINNTGILDGDLARKLFPLDYLSAYVLVNALTRYGQNERSLFTFLSSKEKIGLAGWDEKSVQGFHLGKVYDYIYASLSSYLLDRKFNQDKTAWESVFLAFERVGLIASNEEELEQMESLLKTILLVNLFAREFGTWDEATICEYAKLTMGIPNPKKPLHTLKNNRVITYSYAYNKFKLSTGTTLNIEEAIEIAGKDFNTDISLTALLKQYVNLPIIQAKAYQYRYGTPRLFQYRFAEELAFSEAEGELDGYINILFNDQDIKKDLLKISSDLIYPQLFVVINSLENIRRPLFEIEKIKKVLENEAKDDDKARHMLFEEMKYLENEIISLIDSYLFTSSPDSYWVYDGQEIFIKSKTDFNKKLSLICEEKFGETPRFRNELANREYLSTPIMTARKALLSNLLESAHLKDLGYDQDRFPPQKTIYLSLLRETGIHRALADGIYELGEPTDPSFAPLWNQSMEFLASTEFSKRNLDEFYQQLKSGNLKLKKGFVEFWIPIFLIIKKEDFALYHNDRGYVPYIDKDVLDLIHKKPTDYSIKSYRIEGVKLDLFQQYREITAMAEGLGQGSSFIRIFSAFVKFYRNLPAYTLQTNKLTDHAKGFREAIRKADDPASALFESIPMALGYGKINFEETSEVLKGFVDQLNAAIYELRTAYDELLNRIEGSLLKVTAVKESDFLKYKSTLQSKYKGVKSHLLIPKFKVFHTRLMSKLDDRESWLKSIADQLLGKSIDKMNDQEEMILLESFKEAFSNLDRVLEVHEFLDQEENEAYSIELMDKSGKVFHEKVSLTPENQKKVSELYEQLNTLINKNEKLLNKAVLVRLLKDFL